MSCKDCVHYEKCKPIRLDFASSVNPNHICDYFKNKANFVELPCKVGERVYSIRKDTKVIYECVVCEFIFKKHYDKLEKECKVYILEDNRFTYFDFSSFGKTVFLTKEEAEAKLRERN